jgi:hypothetical protein
MGLGEYEHQRSAGDAASFLPRSAVVFNGIQISNSGVIELVRAYRSRVIRLFARSLYSVETAACSR